MSGAPRPAALTLHLVRHGAADGAAGRCIGHTDLPLSARGRADVARLAAGWPAPPPARLVASDLARAQASADALLGAWWGAAGAPAPAVAVDARLREMDFGRWEGRSWAEIERDDAVAMHAWMRDWQDAAAPGGEGFGDVVARAAAWLADEVRAAADGASGGCGDPDAPDDGRRVVVLHAGSIRALLVHALGLPRALAFRLRVDQARVSVLRVPVAAPGGGAGAGELVSLNADRVAAADGVDGPPGSLDR